MSLTSHTNLKRSDVNRLTSAFIMPSLLSLISTPILLALCLPLGIFAAFTTTLALTTLFLRVLVVYIELGLALLHSTLHTSPSPTAPSPTHAHLHPHSPSHSTPNPNAPTYNHPRRRRSSVASATTPIAKASSFASLAGNGPDRDYEGVGGWRVPGSEAEEALWLGLNSRLELPGDVADGRRHRRSFTGGSGGSGIGNGNGRVVFSLSPQQSRVQSPGVWRMKTPGTSSPEEYFCVRDGALGAGSGVVVMEMGGERRKSSSGSSTDAGAKVVARMAEI